MPSTPLGRYLAQHPDFHEPSSSSSPLPALYADLAAHRSSNRASFEASVDWWARLLFQACLRGVQGTTPASSSSKTRQEDGTTGGADGDRLVLHLSQQLVEECTVDEVGRPLGLGTVAMELQTHRRIYSLATFLASSAPLHGPSTSGGSVSSTAYKVASYPLAWALSQLTLNLGFGETDVEAGEKDWTRARGDWVVSDNVQTLTDAVLSIHRSLPRLSPFESLYSIQTFERQLVRPALAKLCASDAGEAHCSSLDLQVLIKYMVRDRRVATTDGKVIKMEHTEGEDLKAVTEEERGIVNVKETYAKLELQVEEITRRIKERQEKVETLLREKKRDQALSYLRSRRMLEELLEKRTKSLETLHAVLIKIEQAASDVEIVKAYELSTSSLKVLLSDARLQPDRIESSMDHMQETLADADEVRRVVDEGSQGMRRAAGEEELDDDEMEAELRRLEAENEREKEAERKEAGQEEQQKYPVGVQNRQEPEEEPQREAVIAE